MDFKIKLADIVIQIHGQYPYLKDYCKDYLAENEDPQMEINISMEEIFAEKTADEKDDMLPYLETLAALRKISTALSGKNRFLMHGAVLSWKGQGYMFTAPSGTGKSTHIALWKKYLGDEVEIINGDKPIISVTDSQVYAYGTPWAGKEQWQKNTRVPLKGICLLKRGKTNRIQKVQPGDVLYSLLKQVYYTNDAEQAGTILELLDRVLWQVPVYVLECDVSEEAVKCSFEGMVGECPLEKTMRTGDEKSGF